MEFYVVVADFSDKYGADTDAFFEPNHEESVTPIFDNVDDAIAAVQDFCSDCENCVRFFEEYANDSDIDATCFITFRIYEFDLSDALTHNDAFWPYASIDIKPEDNDTDDVAYITYKFAHVVTGSIESVVR